MAQETDSDLTYVDEFNFSVIADDENEDQAFQVSDAEQAEELQLNEVLMDENEDQAFPVSDAEQAEELQLNEVLMDGNEDQAFPVSDAEHAEELQFQEVMMGSLKTSQMANNGSSSSSSPMVQLSLPPSTLQLLPPIPNPEPVEGTKEAGESSHCFCEICADSKDGDQMFRNGSCVHCFCSDCIGKHIASKIQERKTIVFCPGLDCKVVLEVDACRPVLPKDVLERWEEAICEALFPTSQKFYCPFKDCSAMLLNDNEEGEVIRESECPYCHRLFCAQCHETWHPAVECEEFQRMNEDERGRSDLMVRELARDKRWKRCPHCKFYVERAEGCLHMTCRCSFQFCYGCGGEWAKQCGGCA